MSALCWLQKIDKVGCFAVTLNDSGSKLAEICASNANEIFKNLPCTPAAAVLQVVDSAYRYGEAYGYW